MKKWKKNILYIVMVVSLAANMYFVLNIFIDQAIIKIEKKTVLTKKELQNIMNKNYKVSLVNQKVGEYLIQLEGQLRKIVAPSDETLREFAELYPPFKGYSTNINKYHAILSEAFYVSKIYMEDDTDILQIKEFLEKRYGDNNAKMYEILVFETNDHDQAMEVENRLKDGIVIEEIEKQQGSKFFKSYTISMDDIVNNESDHNEIDHNEANVERIALKEEHKVGDVYHLMDSHSMQVIVINDILSIDNNLEFYKDLYFSQNYTSIKNNMINKLKSKYVVSYY